MNKPRKVQHYWCGADRERGTSRLFLEQAMRDSQRDANGQSFEKITNGSLQVPSISLPKGGGAIRGIGEKFSDNTSNGSASITVPLFTTPSRSNFYPQLSISYDSGSGNGVFGEGWKLSVPSPTRKTDKGLPQYRDTQDSDVFILSEEEDLVPAFVQNGSTYRRDLRTEALPDGRTYAVQRYRPRVEGLFARIEKWQDTATGNVFWKSISKDNITSLYGQTVAARIENPNDPKQIFQWLLERSYDDKGNSISYEYKTEDVINVPASPEETNRLRSSTSSANRYIKRIRSDRTCSCGRRLRDLEIVIVGVAIVVDSLTRQSRHKQEVHA